VASGVQCGPHSGKKSKTKTKSTHGVCDGSPQNRLAYLVDLQNQDRRLGGRRCDPGAPRSFVAEDTRRDRKACVEATRRAVTGHPSDGATKRYSQRAHGGRVS
jgi:hypothetical protein